jgi:hypothetical protein
MTPNKMAWLGVASLAMIAMLIVSHRLFRQPAGEAQVSKIEEVRRADPLPEFSEFTKTVHTIIIKKPPVSKSLAAPLNQDTYPVTVKTVPPQEKPVEKPRQPHYVQRDNDDAEPQHNSDGICARYGGHKVTYYRHHHESWRCVYPHRK